MAKHPATPGGWHREGWPSLIASWLRSPAARSLLVLLPIVAGFALFQVGKGNNPLLLANLDSFNAWSVWVGCTFAIWIALGVRSLSLVGTVRALFPTAVPAIPQPVMFALAAVYAVAIGSILVAACGSLTNPYYGPLEAHFDARVKVVVFVGVIATVPSVVALWLIAEALQWTQDLLQINTSDSAGQRFDELRTLWGCSMATLGALSLALSAAVVVVAGLSKFLGFQSQDVVLIGALLAAVFVAVYIPTFLAWRSRARQLVDAVYPTPQTGKPDEGWIEGRARMMQLIGLDVGLPTRLSNAVVALAPFEVAVLTWWLAHKP
ncbi:hypothetical protein ACQP1O_18590 [Nocardia sp. CA-151230]|uniref:hypothetical protein n=1 Tax=Nocardia sp. CA-151230 TaxID=3239982 RepID=UPI003D8A9106